MHARSGPPADSVFLRLAALPLPPFRRPSLSNMNTRHATPDKEAIALLPPFERLALDRITLVTTQAGARKAQAALAAA